MWIKCNDYHSWARLLGLYALDLRLDAYRVEEYDEGPVALMSLLDTKGI